MVFVYFAAACLVSAVLFGLVPGLQASRVDLNATLKEGSRDSGSKRGGILSGALVVFQFMLAVVLLAGAGLFVRGLLEQRASLDGLPAAEVLSAGIQLPARPLPGRRVPLPVLRPAADEPRGNARAAAGRDHFQSCPPSVAPRVAYQLEGEPEAEPGAEPTRSARGHFARLPGVARCADTGGTGFRRSRWLRRPGFDHRDPRLCVARVAGSAGARQAAPRLSGAASAESRGAAAERPPPGRWLTVVGISGDLAQTPNELRPLPVFFIPYAPGAYGAMTIVLRSSGNPTALAAPLRAAMRQIDPDRALGERPDARGGVVPGRLVSARFRQHVPDFCGRRAAAGLDRDLRRRGTDHCAAHAGDRYPDGPGRNVAQHRAARHRAGAEATRRREPCWVSRSPLRSRG